MKRQQCCEFKGFVAQSGRTKRPSWTCLRAKQICCIRTFQTGSKLNAAPASSQENTLRKGRTGQRLSQVCPCRPSESAFCATNLTLLRMPECTERPPRSQSCCHHASQPAHTVSSVCDPERSCLCKTPLCSARWQTHKESVQKTDEGSCLS